MNLIIMILLISLLIIVHELGHFFAAKMFKMRVDKFGFGLPIGPTLYRKQIGETEFLIHAFLLGGYVSFPDDNEESDLPKDSPLRFKNKPIYQRAIVVSAGVVANLVCAIVLVFLTGLFWGNLPSNSYEVSIGKILPSATPSTKASGLQKGDIIYSVNGSKLVFPICLTKYLLHSRTEDGFAAQERIDEKLLKLQALNPRITDTNKPIKIGTVINLTKQDEEKPIKLTNDEILGLEQIKNNETELNTLQKATRDEIFNSHKYRIKKNITLKDLAAASADTYKPITLVVIRKGEKIELNKIYPDENGYIGIEKQIKEVFVPTKNIVALTKTTAEYISYNTQLMVYGLGKMFMGRIPMQEMHGIVAITKIGSDVIENQGLYKGVLLTAIISLNLAFINLLPIPALDGGHLLFLFLEKIRGRELSEKKTELISNFFFYLLILLMILIVFNDIFALITKQI